MAKRWGRRPYPTDDCCRCRLWLDAPAGGRCRRVPGPSVECGEAGRTCLDFVAADSEDWHAMVGRNEGVRGL